MKHIENTQIISLLYTLKFNGQISISPNGYLVHDILDYLREEYHYHIVMTPYSRKGFLEWESSLHHMIRFNSTYNSFMPNIMGVGDDYYYILEQGILKVLKLILEIKEFDLGTVLNNYKDE